jgi:hypothetical protein
MMEGLLAEIRRTNNKKNKVHLGTFVSRTDIHHARTQSFQEEMASKEVRSRETITGTSILLLRASLLGNAILFSHCSLLRCLEGGLHFWSPLKGLLLLREFGQRFHNIDETGNKPSVICA